MLEKKIITKNICASNSSILTNQKPTFENDGLQGAVARSDDNQVSNPHSAHQKKMKKNLKSYVLE